MCGTTRFSGKTNEPHRRFEDVFGLRCADGNYDTHALDDLAQSAGWNVLRPGDAVVLKEKIYLIVISGVVWSRPDLAVLDELAAGRVDKTTIWFFNPDVVFPDARILPGTRLPVQTPILAEYTGTQLSAFTMGAGVRKRIRILFPPTHDVTFP